MENLENTPKIKCHSQPIMKDWNPYIEPLGKQRKNGQCLSAIKVFF